MSPEWRLPIRPHGLPGTLIAFDGVDGSGKTTTTRMTRAYLRACGRTVRGYKLPSRELKASRWFKDYIADPFGSVRTGEVAPLAMCCAVLGDRLMTVRTRILPALRAGRVVVVDRYLFTPLGELLMHRVPTETRAVVEPLIACFPAPDLSVFTTVSAQEASARVRRRAAERDDRLGLDVYEQRVEAFRRLALSNSGLLLDTTRGKRRTFEDLIPHLVSGAVGVR
ncbi:dTMP kinase [Streptomyces hawaiiensis]|uniref:dTMP kinase n=1 Tax=Streptomyces hawaiiensis TaxID=67305 RepID=UPI003653A1B1